MSRGVSQFLGTAQRACSYMFGRGNNNLTHLLLHIGHPKTGTTALQTVLSANATMLLRNGILYPVRARPAEHKHALVVPGMTGKENPRLRRVTGLKGEALSGLSERYWLSLKSEIETYAHDTLVLSAESFWGAGHSPGFRQRLAEICDHVTVVGYARDPVGFFLSRMNQNLRMFKRISLFRPDYCRSAIQAYRTNGFEAVSINAFESAQLAAGDIVTDFCEKYLPAGLPALKRGGSRERGNESVSNEAAALLQEIGTSYAMSAPDVRDRRRNKMVRALREADHALGGTLKPSLRPEIADALVARSADLIWLRDEASIRFANVDYDLIGTTGYPDLDSLHKVEDFSPVDPERLAALRAMTERKIAQIHARNNGARSFFYRWAGGLAR